MAQAIDGGKKTVWAWAVATFFGAGLLKPGPGTYGSVAAMLLWMGAAKGLHPAWGGAGSGHGAGGAGGDPGGDSGGDDCGARGRARGPRICCDR